MTELKPIDSQSIKVELDTINEGEKNETTQNLDEPNHKIERINSPSKLVKLRETFEEWSLLTKFDGYSKIFHTKTIPLKIVWLSLFLIFSSLTAYFVFKNISDYLDYETISKIDIINEKPTKFPMISICSANPFTTKRAENLITNITLLNYGHKFDSLGSWEMITNYSNVYELTKMYTYDKEYSSKNKHLLGNKIVIKKCSFNNQPCSMHRDISWFFSYYYGNCIRFNRALNSSQILHTQTEGSIFGLALILYLPRNQNKYPSLNGDGFKLFINNQSFDAIFSNQINLNPGNEIGVAISRTFSQKTPQPYSECTDLTTFTSAYSQILKDSNRTYSQFECFRLCLQHNINQMCGCYYTKNLQVLRHLPKCSNLTELNCINMQQSNFIIDEECSVQCPLECNTITYDAQLSSVDYPSKNLYENLRKNLSFVQEFENYTGDAFSLESMRENVISLKVFYPFTRYTLITESPKINFYDLLAQIGGSLGMLLGFSIFHLIELVEIILVIIF